METLIAICGEMKSEFVNNEKKQGKISIPTMCFSSCSIENLAKKQIKFRLGLSSHVHLEFLKQKFKFVLRPIRAIKRPWA